MYLSDDPRPPLHDWITEVYDVLYAHIHEQHTDENHCQVLAIDREQAADVLQSTDDLTLEPTDIEYALTRLLDRGYFYEVDNELRVTTRSEDQ